MGKGGEDGSADYRACAVCTRVCQTTHGKGLPYSVPRFHKTVLDYSTPASKNCYMQIPAGYVREHMAKGAKQSYVVEGVTGSEWEMTFNNIGLSGGWKTFAIDYHLEKGDQVMFGLVAPNRFYVNVFDKFGTEKVSTREPLIRRDSRGTVTNKEIDHLLPQNGNHQVSNPTSEGAEVFHNPLQVEHGKRCGEHKSDGVDVFPPGTMSPQHNAQFLNSNGVCADTTPVMASGLNENHEGVQGGGASGSRLQDDSPPEDARSPQGGPRSLNRILEFDPTRALIEKLLIQEPVDCDELEPSGMIDSMSESEDSVQVLLAKAVLAKVRRKKLKKRKSSCITNQVEIVTKATKSGGTFRTEVSTPSLNEDKAVNIKSRSGDWTSKILANLGTDDVTDSLRDDETGARGGTELEEVMHEKSCEELRGRVGGSTGQIECQMCSIQAEPHQGTGDSHGDVLKEPQNIDNGVRVEIVQDIPQLDHRENEAMAMGTYTATAGVVNWEDSVLKRAGEFSNEPSPVFQAALVKEEPDLRNSLRPEMTAAGNHNETCANCGLATIPCDQDQISTPPTSLTCEIPETRTPSSDPPRESVRATGDQKQEVIEAAKTFYTNGPEKLTTRTPSSNGPNLPKGNGRVTEDQKQKALEVAKTFSANTKNPSAILVMRISFVEKTCACFVSVKCAEMLPKAPTELILVDSDGYLRKANWRPERRYMQGLGWKDFVDSKNLQVNDVCVMEVIDKSSQQFKVLIHIFHAHEMDTSKDKVKEKERGKEELGKGKETLQEKETQQEKEREQTPPIVIALPYISQASPSARTRHQEKRSQGASQLYGLLPSKRRKRKKKSSTNGAVEIELSTMPASAEDEIPEAEVQLTLPSTEEAMGNPGPEPSMEQEEHGSLDPIPPTDPSHEERNTSKRERKKVRMLPPLTGSKEPAQTLKRDKWNEFRKHYSVAKLVDRRKSLHGVVFLVELKETVTLSNGHKKGKTKQDEKGRWWVPHSHFTSDFSSCYIE